MALIEIDGKKFDVENGKMIIEVADEAGIYIPRFCYHKKLSVAANCRMCLVQVENNRKPVPACATPITDGMKVFTKSEEAIHSQKAVMEFLLINHPLDCPICDQGGECELQDLALGFGRDSARYEESKRAVDDDELGSLISTEMTRCIHCTRCVRFGDEVAGLSELGVTGRGEKMQISTYVEHSLKSEVSGNIIDLCPVGALTSKPFRFSARPWELNQHEGIALHDCLGSNIHIHTLRHQCKRVVPKENESINETWLSDRDRFGYLGLSHSTRAAQPLIKKEGQWQSVDWKEALTFTAEKISSLMAEHGAKQFAAFASPSSPLEAFYLLQKLLRSLGSNHLDFRIHQADFRDQAALAKTQANTLKYKDLENQSQIFIIGSNLCREVPLAGLRVRKAFKNGARIFALNPLDYAHPFELEEKCIIGPDRMPALLAQLLLDLVDQESNTLPAALQALLPLLQDKSLDREQIQRLATALSTPNSVIVLGELFHNHPEAAVLRSLVQLIVEKTGAKILAFSTGSNTNGAYLAGMLPHRTVGGKAVEEAGLDMQAALAAKLKGYLLLDLEPGFDIANPSQALEAMEAAELVILLSPYQDPAMKDYADIILPIAIHAESEGTYLNIDEEWQSVKAVLAPPGEARPTWKILRVLGHLLHCPGFEYTSTDEILEEITLALAMTPVSSYEPYYPETMALPSAEFFRVGEWPLYRGDSVLRRAEALQYCAAADKACLRVNPLTADQLKLGSEATVSQGDIEITLPLQRDERVAPNVIWVANAMPETSGLGPSFAAIRIEN